MNKSSQLMFSFGMQLQPNQDQSLSRVLATVVTFQGCTILGKHAISEIIVKTGINGMTSNIQTNGAKLCVCFAANIPDSERPI